MDKERMQEIVEEMVCERLYNQGWHSEPAKYPVNRGLRIYFEDMCAFELNFDKGWRMMTWAYFNVKDEHGFKERLYHREPHFIRLRSGSVNDLANQVEKMAGLLKYSVMECATTVYKWNLHKEDVEQ